MELENIRYTPELCGFEALARFHEDGMVISYPVFMQAPLNAEFTLIMRGLAAKAHTAHRAPQKGMVMRRPAEEPPGHAMPRLARRLMRGLLGHQAA